MGLDMSAYVLSFLVVLISSAGVILSVSIASRGAITDVDMAVQHMRREVDAGLERWAGYDVGRFDEWAVPDGNSLSAHGGGRIDNRRGHEKKDESGGGRDAGKSRD